MGATRSERCCAGPRASTRLNAVLISPMWEKAWGKLPTRLPLAARDHANAEQSIEQLVGLIQLTEHRVCIGEPEAAGQKGALSTANAILASPTISLRLGTPDRASCRRR